jgi:short-subunit dehydrogenase
MKMLGKVVVITGASSGLGRAAAIAFAARGCRVVLAGRRLEALEDAALECRVAGGQAVVRQTDVTSEDEVKALAALALEQTGVIDVWVNNAGVTLFGSLEHSPIEEHRQVIETNLFGSILGARAVLPIFRQQKRGVLINVGSILSKIGQPFVPSYVISKFALRGLTEALRAELADQDDIHVCSLLPYVIDTEHFESGANHVGHGAYGLPPMQSPEKVAKAMVSLAEHPRREVHVPRIALLGLAAHELFPRTVERIIFDALGRWHFGKQGETQSAGNLYSPQKKSGGVHGKRRPLLKTTALVLFAAQRFVEIQLKFLFRVVLQQGSPSPLRVRSARTPSFGAPSFDALSSAHPPQGAPSRAAPYPEATSAETRSIEHKVRAMRGTA